MAAIRTNFWDLRSCCFIVFLLIGYITKGSTRLSNIPKDCWSTDENFDELGRCKPCFTGHCCTDRANAKPIFQTESGEWNSDKVTVTEDGLMPGVVVYKATAEDKDRDDACTTEYKAKCPCGEFEYTLMDRSGIFKIDRVSGEISVPNVRMLQRQKYAVTVVAQNLDNSAGAELSLTILSEVGEANDAYNVDWNDGYNNKDDFSHRRMKRSTGPPPGNVTFTLVKKAPNENLVDMKVGQKIAFTLTIAFPNEGTNMLVELFTPDNETIIMMLCGVEVVSKGSNLVTTESGTPVLESIKNNLYYDRAILDFGNVSTANPSETDINNNEIVIEYEAVMLDTVTNNGSTYWVSAGAEYNFEEDVWVGQASFVCINDEENYPGTPTVNFTGPSNMTIGSSAVFIVDLFIPYPVATLSFDAFAPLNTSNVMSICAVRGKDVAVNYECGFDITKIENVQYAEGNVKGNARVHFEIGKVFNKGARDDGNSEANNRITVEFVAHLYDDASFVGQKYWVGAAVEIDTDQIWAGQIEITADAKTTGGSTPEVTFHQPAITPIGDKTSETKPVKIEAKASISESSTGDYRLEVKGPSGSQIQICSVGVSAVGGYLPCVDTTAEPEYLISTPGGTVVDKAILELGGITNTGSWGSVNASSEPDVITFEALVKATNYSSLTSYNVEFAFIVNNNTVDTKTVSVTVEAKAAAQEIANDSVPVMKMEFKSGTENVPVKGATRVALEITTKRDVIYPVMDIEFIMPNDTEGDGHSPITICRTEITFTGKNIPCAIKQVVNKGIAYDSKYGDKNYDRTIVNMGYLCNNEIVNDTAEDKMILETVAQLNTHTALTNGTQHWISAGVMFSDKMMWVGQLAVIAIEDDSLESKISPHIEVVTNSSAKTPLGYSAVYTLVIKTGSDDHAHYTVNVSTTANELTICNVRVLAKGHNLPCLKEDIKNTLDKDASGRSHKSSIDLGVVSNVGTSVINPNNIFDENTVMIEVVVQLSKSATNAQNYRFNIDTKYGTQTKTNQVDVEATTDMSNVDTATTNASVIEMGVLPITSTDDSSVVSKGQAKRIFLDIFVPIGVTQELTAKVLAPINQASVVQINYIGILDIGENLPCLHRDGTESNLIDRTTIDPGKNTIAALKLGVVCNIGANKDDNNANRIRVEAVVRVLKNDSINVGDTITLSGALNTNDQIISIVQHSLTVADNFTDIIGDNMTLLNDTAIKLNITDDPIVMKVNEVKTIPIHLIIPPYLTTVVKFDVDLPMNDSAVLTYKDLKVVGSGLNLAGYGNLDDEITITEKSSRNTSQINKAYVNLGIVTNAGSSHRIDQANYDDDVINLELTLAMADSAINTDGSTHWISLGVKIGIYIVILEHKVQVSKDGSEKPCIEFTGQVDNAFSSATEVVINGLLRHANESTAESNNMTAFVLFPPFLRFKEMNTINDSLVECSHSNDECTMRLTCSWFFFTDVLAFTAVLERALSYEVPTQVSGTDAVITLATASTMHGSAEDYSCNMNYVNHTVTVTQKAATSCVSEILGVATSTKIQDCQISGSPDHYTAEGPLNGRKGGSGFSPFVRKGSLMKERYFQVYLGNKATIHKIDIAQRSGVGVQITKIQPHFSNDGYAWMPGKEIAVASVPSTVAVTDSIEARYVRIYITDDNQQGQKQLGVTFELHGCYVTNDITSGNICDNVVTEDGIANPDWHRSGFLNSGGNLYVCDAVADDGLKQECYKSADAGDSWEKLDERLGCMAGHDPTNGHLYAVAHDGVTYMSSEDNGETWASVRKEKYESAKSETGFSVPTKMKWEANAALEGANPDAAHKNGIWGATFDGVKKDTTGSGSWLLRFNWASCCGK